MSTPESKVARYEIDELQSALRTETQLRLEAENRLRRAQEEFSDFILNAAHDLREPLRTVTAYSELLTRKDVKRSNSETDQFCRYIREGTARAHGLISGMVDCVTASSDSRYLVAVDMNEVFGEAASHTESAAGLPATTITRDALPVLSGDFEKLTKVAGHLLDNAARYCEKAESLIHVSARREGSLWLFTVQDNGPGIEDAYRERIFEPFKRLHGREYAGCGLGLTFCRRAIESHGGRIWVESTPGDGSTFCFTLPAAG